MGAGKQPIRIALIGTADPSSYLARVLAAIYAAAQSGGAVQP